MSTGRLRRALHAFRIVAGNSLLLALALELLVRGASWAWHLRHPSILATLGPAFSEDLHLFFQNARPPGPDIDAGPELGGWLIDPPLPPGAHPGEEDGRARILFLGGSTLAYQVPSLVREELERRGVPVRAYNLAASWHSSLHSLYKLWTYGDLVRPDLVVVLEGVNDFYRGFTPPGYALPAYRGDYSHFAGALNPYLEVVEIDGRPAFRAPPRPSGDPSFGALAAFVSRNSALVRASRQAVRRFSAPRPVPAAMPPEVYLRSLPDFTRNLRNLRLSAATLGVPVAFLTMPHTEGSGRFLSGPGGLFTNDGARYLDEAGFEDGMRRFNAVVRTLGDGAGASVIDLEPAIADPGLFADEVHLMEDGPRLEARMIADAILGCGLLGARMATDADRVTPALGR